MSFKRLLTIALLLCFVVLVLLPLGCGESAQSDPFSSMPSVPDVPKPPAAWLPAGSTPAEQAVQIADALEKPAGRLAAWLGAYQTLGIPVIDDNGKPLHDFDGDPIGPPYWVVWNESAADDAGLGVTLADAGKIITAMPEGTTAKNAGAVLLSDLKAATASSDPQVKLLGLLVRERILRGSSRSDLMAADATPESLVIDPATIELLHWVTVRGEMVELAKTGVVGSLDSPTTVFASQNRFTQSSGSSKCSQIWGDKEVTSWMNWVIKKTFGAGFRLPGMTTGLPGIVGILTSQGAGNFWGQYSGGDSATRTPPDPDATRNQAIGRMTGQLNAAGTLLSFDVMMKALTVEGDMNGPLTRTKSATKNGEEKTITWKLSFNKEKGADGNEAFACAANYISNSFGVKFSLPADGPIEGAELTFQPGKNMPEKVLFNGDVPNQRVSTGAGGAATLKVIGNKQKKELPEKSKQYDDTFTVEVEAQPEAENGKSIFDMFMDSMSYWSNPANPVGAVSPLVDLLKTVHWSLGEFEFGLIDWKLKGWKVEQSSGDWIFSTTKPICDTSKPFKVEGNAPMSQQFLEFTPGSEDAGIVQIGGILAGDTIYSGQGTYKIVGLDEGKPQLIITSTQTGEQPEGSATHSGTDTFDLIPLDTDECKE